MSIHDIFVILNYISVFVMAVCTFIVSTHSESRMQKYAFMVTMSLLGCCIGFLFRIEADNVNTLIAGQKLVYAFTLHGMFYMLLFICEYCKFETPKWIVTICNIIDWAISFIVLTLDHHQLFYKTYWAVDMGTYSVLEKEYGIVHTITILLFAIYMAVAVILAVIFSVKNIKKRSRYVWHLLVAVMIPCLSYIIPKVFDFNNDIQPIAFAAFTAVLLALIYRDNLYDIENIAAEYSVKSMTDAFIVFSKEYTYKGCNELARKILPELNDMQLDSDISGENSTIRYLLNGKSKEYVYKGEIYEVSVRPINDDNGHMSGRVVWLENVTVQRKYTDLLSAQKMALESKVDILSIISYKDELTNLNNRRSYEEKLSELRNRENCRGIVFVACDVNGLKQTNDDVGHSAGDELIKGSASVLTDVLSEYGNIYRTGGDEFFAILDNFDKTEDDLKKMINEKMESWRGNQIDSLSFSFGIVSGDDFENLNVDDLIKMADNNMYASKKEYYEKFGKDRRHR